MEESKHLKAKMQFFPSTGEPQTISEGWEGDFLPPLLAYPLQHFKSGLDGHGASLKATGSGLGVGGC